MVYCGKASQGCQNCRTRRIKCDKKRPECSQCIRIGKVCPGYRDQLSLMFRDESSKVIQKAHAQWGSSVSPIDASQAISSSASSSDSSPPAAPATPRSLAPAPATIHRKVDLNLEQRGLQFYVNRYLINHPDCPKTNEDIVAYTSSSDPFRNVMIAVGLAGLSNLQGDQSLNMLARSKYVTALKQMGQLLVTGADNPATLPDRLRGIVTLAMFEVVQGKGPKSTVGSANLHINGALAVLRSVLPMPGAPDGGARGALQLVFAMFIPCQTTSAALPPAFFDALNVCRDLLHGTPEVCSVDLALTTARFLQISAITERTVLYDERPVTNDIIQQLLLLDAAFESLEDPLFEAYPYSEERGDYPPAAVFRGRWHAYGVVWGVRMWNHYRWARILVNQTLVKFTTRYPVSSHRYISPAQRGRCYSTMRRLAEDILISTPATWHHPILDSETAKKMEVVGPGGAGAVGLPSLLWQLVVAGCAPGVPPEFWDWAHDVLQVVWKDMGMQHASVLAEIMEKHQSAMEKEAINHLLKVEDED
ncbi:hypothetical protein F4779DRAFT_624892 [Xylariaceae sp. FL0662B]|nr:hypothetical protein F4779DRAFT_624892 [Xylariaceae sp. FL0662B]